MANTSTSAVSDFLIWWGTQLRSFVPARLADFFRSSSIHWKVETVDDGFKLYERSGLVAGFGRWREIGTGEAAYAALARRRDGGGVARVFATDRLAVIWPEQSALRHRLRLPQASGVRLQEVVRLQAMTLVPEINQDLYAGVDLGSVVVSDDGWLQADLLLLDTSRAPKSIRNELLRPDRTTDVQVSTGDGTLVDLNPLMDRSRGLSTNARIMASLALVAVALGIWAFVAQSQKSANAIEVLRVRAADAATDARKAREQLNEANQWIASTNAVLARRYNQLKLTDIWAELTQVLPPTASIQSLEFEQAEVRVTGKAMSAASLIETLENSELFEDVRFTSAVTMNAGDQLERFQLTTGLKDGH